MHADTTDRWHVPHHGERHRRRRSGRAPARRPAGSAAPRRSPGAPSSSEDLDDRAGRRGVRARLDGAAPRPGAVRHRHRPRRHRPRTDHVDGDVPGRRRVGDRAGRGRRSRHPEHRRHDRGRRLGATAQPPTAPRSTGRPTDRRSPPGPSPCRCRRPAATLDVTATPAARAVAPGAATTVDVEVRRARRRAGGRRRAPRRRGRRGRARAQRLRARRSVGVVLRPAADHVATTYGRDGIVLVDPGQLLGSPSRRWRGERRDHGGHGRRHGPGRAAPATPTAKTPAELDTADRSGASEATRGGGAPIAVRTNFDALAVFAPDVTTDADGRATVDVPLPDNLTRYRVMVVAVAGADQFGSARGQHHRPPAADGAARPRPASSTSATTSSCPVVVQNQTRCSRSTSTSSSQIGEPRRRRLRPGCASPCRPTTASRSASRWPPRTSGPAAFRVTAVSGELADSATVDAAGATRRRRPRRSPPTA